MRCGEWHSQRGAALVLALLAVVVVAVLATRLGRDELLLRRLVELQEEQQQARAYLEAAEMAAREALLLDLRAGAGNDTLVEAWAQPRRIALTGALVDVCVSDLQGRLSLNALAAPASEGLSSAQRRFIRLLQALPIEKPPTLDEATALANAVFDWVDADNESRTPGGAEALQYLQAARAWRPANQDFVSVEELRQVEGWNAALVLALTPFVGVWANGDMNLNTLDSQLAVLPDIGASLTTPAAAPVLLRSLNQRDSLLPLPLQMASGIAEARRAAGGAFQSLELFSAGGLSALQLDMSGIGLQSAHFTLAAEVHTGGHHYRLNSILQRTVDAAGVPQVRIRSRRYSNGDLGEGQACVAALPQ